VRYVNLRLRLVCAGKSSVRKAAGAGPPPVPPSLPPPPPPVSGNSKLVSGAATAPAGQHQGESSPQSVSSVRSPVLLLLRLVNCGFWFRVWGLGSHSSIFLLLLLFLTLSLCVSRCVREWGQIGDTVEKGCGGECGYIFRSGSCIS